jgi:hypothetical protein
MAPDDISDRGRGGALYAASRVSVDGGRRYMVPLVFIPPALRYWASVGVGSCDQGICKDSYMVSKLSLVAFYFPVCIGVDVFTTSLGT